MTDDDHARMRDEIERQKSWTRQALKVNEGLSTENNRLRAAIKAAVAQFDGMHEHAGADVEYWPEYQVLKAALEADE